MSKQPQDDDSENPSPRKLPPFAWQPKEALRLIRQHFERIDIGRGEPVDMVTSAIAVYVALCEIASDKMLETFEAIRALITGKSGVKKTTVKTVLHELQSIGLITIDYRREGNANLPCVFTLHRLTTYPDKRPTPIPDIGRREKIQVSTHSKKLRPVEPSTEKSVNDPSLKNLKKNLSEEFYVRHKEVFEKLEGEDFERAWMGFEQMRIKVRKPMTNRARELVLIKLCKLSGDVQHAVEILNQSTVCDWQDIYPLKNEQRQAPAVPAATQAAALLDASDGRAMDDPVPYETELAPERRAENIALIERLQALDREAAKVGALPKPKLNGHKLHKPDDAADDA